MEGNGRRIRRAGVLGILGALLAAAFCCGLAQADTRAVSGGNLWSIDERGSVLRIDPDGDSDEFAIPGYAEAITADAKGGVKVVSRSNENFGGSTVVWSIDKEGTVQSSFGLDRRLNLLPYSSRDFELRRGTTWVSQGWVPCQENTAGNLSVTDSFGASRLVPRPIVRHGTEIYPSGEIAVDGAGRTWVETYFPIDERCVKGRAVEWGGSLGHLMIDQGKVLSTNCGWSSPTATVTSDGSGWCFGGKRFYRMDLAGFVTEFDYPETWADPNFLRPDTEGRIWFAAQTTVTDGVYDQDWTIASVSPDGEFRTYPDFDDVLTQDVGRFGGDYIGLFDWRFTDQGTAWLLDRWRSQDNPLKEIVDVPEGVSHGLLPSRPSEFYQPVAPSVPTPTPEPETFTLNIQKAEIGRNRLRFERVIPVTVWTSHTAKVRVRAQITHRLARKLGLRSKKSKNLRPYRLGIATGEGIQGFSTLNIQLSKRKAESLAGRAVGRVKILAMAESDLGRYLFGRFTQLRK